MNCSEALDLLLEADLPELEGKGDSELAGHVQACLRCRAVADRVLVEQRRLGELMVAVRSKTTVEQALSLAEVQALRTWRSRRIWRAAVPFAAAAVIAGIIVGRNSGSGTLENVWQGNPTQAVAGLDLETPPGKDVAVFEVEDRPDIVVVWFYEQGD